MTARWSRRAFLRRSAAAGTLLAAGGVAGLSGLMPPRQQTGQGGRPGMVICSGVASLSDAQAFKAAGAGYCAGIASWAAAQPSAGGPVDIADAVPRPLDSVSLTAQAALCAQAGLTGMVIDLGVDLNPGFDQTLEQYVDYVGNVWPGVANQGSRDVVFSARHWSYAADYLRKFVAQLATVRVAVAGRRVPLLAYVAGIKVGGCQNNEARYPDMGDADPHGTTMLTDYRPSTSNPWLGAPVQTDSFSFANNPVWGTTGPVLVCVNTSSTAGVLAVGTITGNTAGQPGVASNVHDLTAGSDGYPHVYKAGTPLKLASLWPYGPLPQTGANSHGDYLPPGVKAAPIRGYIPYLGVDSRGTKWSPRNDQAAWDWHQQSLNSYVGFLLSVLSAELVYWGYPNVNLFVSHPDLGLRQTPVLAAVDGGASTNQVMQPGLSMLAKGLDTGSLMASYGAPAGYPFGMMAAPNCTAFDLGYGGSAASPLTMPNAEWAYDRAVDNGVAAHIIGEDSGPAPNWADVFSPGGPMDLPYFGVFAAVGTAPGSASLAEFARQLALWRARRRTQRSSASFP